MGEPCGSGVGVTQTTIQTHSPPFREVRFFCRDSLGCNAQWPMIACSAAFIQPRLQSTQSYAVATKWTWPMPLALQLRVILTIALNCCVPAWVSRCQTVRVHLTTQYLHEFTLCNFLPFKGNVKDFVATVSHYHHGTCFVCGSCILDC
jgi:hypothetical protein